ncbi:MAG: PIN domain-containing protein, partial [Thalassotalea sp.]|nr:PIN domain-containing protein [Thalassotalea sp.]
MNEESTIYVLDTNILLHEPFAFLSFQEHDVVIPMTVLEE